MSVLTGLVDAVEIFGLIFIGTEIGIALFALFRNTYLKSRYEKKHNANNYTPSCAVVIPTKGLPRDAERVFGAYLKQDYPAYRVYFVVESEDDDGVPVLNRLTGQYENAQLIIAGLSLTGCQQNHNMIAGAREAGDVEILVFADNDIAPEASWLRRLVAPLSDTTYTVSTAYRWLKNRIGSWGEDGHIFINMTFYAHFSLVASTVKNALWGGSFAIRRYEYEALDVASRWNETVSDDMSLGLILARNGRKSCLIPGFLIETDDVIPVPGETVGWISRQLLNVKACQYPLWAFAIMPVILVGMGLYCFSVCSVVVWLAMSLPFHQCGGYATVIFLSGELMTGLLYSLLGPVRNRFRLIARIPLSRLLQFAGAIQSFGKQSLLWAGVEYRFDRSGRITDIIRTRA